MINWEELKNIHVIRKLEEVLAQWFHTEVYFLDDSGSVRNFDPRDKSRTWHNPIAAAVMGKEKGREALMSAMKDAHQRLVDAKQAHLVVDGPAGFEKALISAITYNGEIVGSVYAYAFSESEVTKDQKKRASAWATGLGVDSATFQKEVDKFSALEERDRKYFFELVHFVAAEIVSFHTEIAKREDRIHALNNQLGERYSYHSMIGKSKPMQQLYSLLDRVTVSDSTVLVQGENGTGKELIAKAIHFQSPRKDKPFIPVNCSAIPETLIESEFFGYMRGAFTGANTNKIGFFEAANNGTLFLDEIGELPLAMQSKFLRVLQQGTVTPVGSTQERKVNVRIVAATNRDLKAMVDDGRFREDLYYRLNVINLVVPALRDRKEDLPVLMDHFLMRHCKSKGVPLKAFEQRAMQKVFEYTWPGNVRELENEIERLVVLSGQDTKIALELLSPRIRDFAGGGGSGTFAAAGSGKAVQFKLAGKLKDAIEELERTMILEGLRRTKWNKSKLAKELGISRAGLIMKVDKYQLDKRKLAREGGEGEQAS